MYHAYNTDFGPLDLSMVYKYCRTVQDYLSNEKYSKLSIYHYTCKVPAKRANSAFLIGAFQVLVLNRTPEEAWEPFQRLPRLLPFRDASTEGSSFDLTVFHCLKALERARNLNWFSLDTFDLESYDRFCEVKNGGFNWIIPEKFLAFANPSSRPHQPGLSPEDYCLVFKPLNISAVVRLNTPSYDSSKFTRRGIRHYELYFHDGSVPCADIVDKFLEISEREKVIAIHCQAGLGRTATLIGCFAIKYYNFTGHEFIAWARLCRPGSVLGPQQHFLCEFFQNTLGLQEIERPVMTPYEQFKAEYGDVGQGARLSSCSIRDTPSVEQVARKGTPVNYRTKFNQLVNIDPVLIKLYGKHNK